jgi:hypothetical protein
VVIEDSPPLHPEERVRAGVKTSRSSAAPTRAAGPQHLSPPPASARVKSRRAATDLLEMLSAIDGQIAVLKEIDGGRA